MELVSAKAAAAQALADTPTPTTAPTAAPVSNPLGIDLGTLKANLQVAGMSPFLQNGGAIDVKAGRDLKGAVLGSTQQDVTQWWWRAGTANGSVATAWWSRYDLFNQGIATFGGGDITLAAARDAIQVHASAANSGWRSMPSASTGSDAGVPFVRGGASVSLLAGRDVMAGRLFATTGQLNVISGGRIASDTSPGVAAEDARLQLLFDSTQVRINAASHIDSAAVRSAGLTASPSTRGNGNTLGSGRVLVGIDAGASLSVLSASGDVRLRPEVGRQAQAPALDPQLPGEVQIVAAQGSLQIDQGLTQNPSGTARTVLLAQTNVTLANANVGSLGGPLAIGVYPATAFAQSTAQAVQGYQPPLGAAGAVAPVLDASDRNPVRVAAVTGDVVLKSNFSSARPVDIEAGRDISFSGGSARMTIQHQDRRFDNAAAATPVSELSLLKAGRDIRDMAVDIAGPGDLVLLAGRDVVLDSGTKAGVVASGNTNNSTLLPNQAANITVVAGLRGDDSDYRSATLKGFGLLGVSGWQGKLGSLYRAVGGAGDATVFAALSVPAQLDAIGSLLGSSAYQTGLGNFVRALPARAEAGDQARRIAALLGKPVDDPAVTAYAKAAGSLTQPAWSDLSVEQAAQAFSGLPEAQRAAAVPTLLLQQFATLAPAARRQLMLDVAQPQQLAALGDYVRQVSSRPQLSDAEALAAFESLPVERQIPWLNRQLVSELRTAGRAAAALDGDARWQAYANGYLAVNTVFPVEGLAKRPGGDILLPASQVKTVQQGDISLFAPGGGVNAGEVVASGLGKSPSQLGIVTVNGGNISALVQADFAVNQSRVFTLDKGDLLLFSTAGSIDAGRGAKTVVGAPAPVLRLDSNGNLVYDTSGSFSGSGIAVLNAQSNLDLYAPAGDINAGEAGIRSKGNAFLAAERVVNAIDIQVGGKTTGGGKVDAPAPVLSAPPNTALTPTSAGLASSDADDDKKKRRKRRNLLLEFLGFGSS